MYEDFANTFRGEKTLQANLTEDLKVRHCLFALCLVTLLSITVHNSEEISLLPRVM